MLVQEGFFLFY